MSNMISWCMITAGEASLEAAVASIRPHVDEVVAIVTRPASIVALGRYEKLFDHFVVDSTFFPLGEDGEVVWEKADFAAARNASFALATGDVLVWGDSDDEVIGGENLRPLVESLFQQCSGKGLVLPRTRVLCKYEYAARDGQVVVEQWRERIVLRGTPYAWEHPVHETLVATDGKTKEYDVKDSTIVWRHLRPADSPRTVRNLRILLAEQARNFDAARSDPWLQLNLAQELQLSQRFEEALSHLEAHINLSKRVDELAFACVAASECALALGLFDLHRQEEAIDWTRRAQGYRRCFETVFAEAKIRFARGASGQQVELERAAVLLGEALRFGPTDTPLGTRPIDYGKHAPEMLRVAHEMLGDWRGAIAACNWQEDRNDPELAMHRRRYKREIDRANGVVASVKTGLDIVIACGPTMTQWDPVSAAEKGIGGSETAVIEVSKRLAAQGHMVRVIADCGRAMVHDGVWWLPADHMQEVGECDVAVAWRDARVVDCCEDARVKLVWAHDLGVFDLTHERVAAVDRVMGLTVWHLEYIRKLHGIPLQKAFRTSNGIDLARFGVEAQLVTALVGRDPHKAIYSSSPDRGLVVLLDLWPQILAQVPDATLDVYYGFAGVEKAQDISKNLNFDYTMARVRRQMAELPGVTHHGRVDQKTLARAMMGAGVLAYPTGWHETSCITAMEAQAAGMRIVTSDLAALSETVGERGTLIEGDWLSEKYQESFVTAVVDAMLVSDDTDRQRSRAYARTHFSWDRVVDEWVALFDKLLKEREDNGELPPYEPDPEWLAAVERSAAL